MGRRHTPEAYDVALPLAGLGSAVSWLRQRDVPVDRLADAFGTTSIHIRVLDHRARHEVHRHRQASPVNSPSSRFLSREHLGVRLEEDAVLLSPRGRRRIEALQERIHVISTACTASGQFTEAIAALGRLRQVAGFPASTHWLRCLADLSYHQAWFAVHSGLTTTALKHARRAFLYAQEAFRESDDRYDLKRLGDAALIASNASLLSHRPADARWFLSDVRLANERMGREPGSEYHRQLGVAWFLSHADDNARSSFERAASAMERLGEADHPLQVQLVSDRHLSLVHAPNWGRAEGLLEAVGSTWPPASLVMLCAAVLPFSPTDPMTQASFGTWPAHFAYLKSVFYAWLVGPVFVLWPFHFVVVMQRQLSDGRYRDVLALLTNDTMSVPPRGTRYPRVWALLAYLAGLFLLNYVGVNYLFGGLQAGPYRTLFMSLILVRVTVWLTLPAICIWWYSGCLSELRRECLAVRSLDPKGGLPSVQAQ